MRKISFLCFLILIGYQAPTHGSYEEHPPCATQPFYASSPYAATYPQDNSQPVYTPAFYQPASAPLPQYYSPYQPPYYPSYNPPQHYYPPVESNLYPPLLEMNAVTSPPPQYNPDAFNSITPSAPPAKIAFASCCFNDAEQAVWYQVGFNALVKSLIKNEHQSKACAEANLRDLTQKHDLKALIAQWGYMDFITPRVVYLCDQCELSKDDSQHVKDHYEYISNLLLQSQHQEERKE